MSSGIPKVFWGLRNLIDSGPSPPANKLRASQESTRSGTQTKLEPGLAGLSY